MNSFDPKTSTIQIFLAPPSGDMDEYVPTIISDKRLQVPLSLLIPQTLQPPPRDFMWDEEAQIEMLDEYRGSLQWVTGVLLVVGLLVLVCDSSHLLVECRRHVLTDTLMRRREIAVFAGAHAASHRWVHFRNLALRNFLHLKHLSSITYVHAQEEFSFQEHCLFHCNAYCRITNMRKHNLPHGMESHRYNVVRERVGVQTLCETCNVVMNTRDWNSHRQGKKHRETQAKIVQAEHDARATLETERLAALAAERGDQSWGDEAIEAAADDDFSGFSTANGNGNKSNGAGSGRACHNCGQEGHFSKECPSKRSGGGRACHNCGQEGHISKECPEPRVPKCRKCNQPGHIARECDVKICDNCDAHGHEWRECTLKKDMGKIRSKWFCPNCKQLGHAKTKCPNPAADGGFGGGFDNSAGFDNAAVFGNTDGFDNAAYGDTTAAAGEWDTNGAGNGGDGWDNGGGLARADTAAEAEAGMW